MSEPQHHNVPSKRFVAALYVPLLVPALLPLYFAFGEDDPFIIGVMIATAVAVALFNAVMLIMVYRHFAGGAQ